MFIGHYGIAFGVKAIYPDIPLPALMISTQMMDIAFSGLVLAKVERLEIDPTANPTVPLRLPYMPYSHSLTGAIALSIVSALLAALLYPSLGLFSLIVVGFVCLSHWMLDLIVHDRDLPLIGNRSHVGFGLWHNRPASIALELAVIMIGAIALFSADVLLSWKVGVVGAVMVVFQAISFFSPPPNTPPKMASTMLTVFMAMIAVGWWMEIA